MRHRLARAMLFTVVGYSVGAALRSQTPSDGERAIAPVLAQLDAGLAGRDSAALRPLLADAFTLASPTEEAVRTTGAGQLRFTLDAAGRPVAAALVRGGRALWRAVREPSQWDRRR